MRRDRLQLPTSGISVPSPKLYVILFTSEIHRDYMRYDQSRVSLMNFRSDLEFKFASLWVELFPDLDLIHEWVLYKPKRGKPTTLDFYNEVAMVGIELNGGIHQKMGHSSGSGIQRDYRKAQICAARGILLFPLSSADAESEEVLQSIADTIAARLAECGVNNFQGKDHARI